MITKESDYSRSPILGQIFRGFTLFAICLFIVGELCGVVIAITTKSPKSSNRDKNSNEVNNTSSVVETVEEPEALVLKSNEDIAKEVIDGLWGSGSEREEALTQAGYNYQEIQNLVNSLVSQSQTQSSVSYNTNYSGGCLTMSGGVYFNPETGLKETWYSQRVLPGGGLVIPGRHVNSEGFVCDEDGYICVASSTYAKGTVISTSRGTGKVYDCGCAPGTLDLYTDW